MRTVPLPHGTRVRILVGGETGNGATVMSSDKWLGHVRLAVDGVNHWLSYWKGEYEVLTSDEQTSTVAS